MNQKINILHVTYNMGIGGTEQVIYQLVNHADKSVFENAIVCLEGEIGPIGHKLQQSGTAFHILNRSPGFDTSLIKSIREILRENNVHIVHCHQYTPYVYGVLAALFTDAKVVFTEHGRFHPDSYSWKRRLVNQALGLLTSSIIAISEATKNALAEYEWFRKSTISVIYNGIEANVPTAGQGKGKGKGKGKGNNTLQLTDENIVFGTITRFDTIKNLPMMVRAFAKVYEAHPDARLLLVGDGDQKIAIEELVKELKVEQAVIFTGFQTDTQKYMSLIDVYILSSFSEGTSMTLLEAMSFSTCCIVTAVGGNTELIQDQINGKVVESDNTVQLAETMLQLTTDKATRMRLGENAKKTFDNKFALNQMIQSYKEVYLKITSNG